MDTASDSALADRIGSWLKGLHHKHFDVAPLAGDVSARRYFRARDGSSRAIVAVYPEELREAAERFLATTTLLEEAGVRVPGIHAYDADLGLMLVEDAGAGTVFDERARGWPWLASRLRSASNAVERIQALDAEAVAAINPALDAEALFRELESTWELHLEPNGLCGPDPVATALRGCLRELCDRLETDGLVPCHRDFMARNLVAVPASRDVMVLDHQDLRQGPRAYDLASLTNDSVFLSPDQGIELLGHEVWGSPSFRRAAAQRSLKIVGTFVAFARRGNPRYLQWVDACLDRAFVYLTSLPEGEALGEPLRALWRTGSGG